MAADWLILTKMDLLKYLDFDLQAAQADVKNIKPSIEIFQTFCSKKEIAGIDKVANAIINLVNEKKLS